MKDVIEQAKSILKDVTPLSVDCGLLCDCACCADSSGIEDGESGMLLFPSEEDYYADCTWGKIEDTEFFLPNGRNIKLFLCNEFCVRDERPLACMIFPLFYDVARKIVVTDVRGRGICPLALFKPDEEFENEFVSAVKQAFEILITDEECKDYTEMICEEFKYYL